LKLFQYWDAPPPPPDVAGWIEGFRTQNPELEHVLLDHAAATGLIARHFGPREVAAFAACAVPAMQADYLRLCLMAAEGGIYMDADHQPHAPLATLIADVPHAFMPLWRAVVANGELMFRAPRHPFIEACLTVATDNIVNRRFDNVLMATGPGVCCAVRGAIDVDARRELDGMIPETPWAAQGWYDLVARADALVQPDDALVAAYRQITLMDVGRINQWMGSLPPAYKETDRHWLRWKGSIYR